jgi:hypothetical protein
LHPLVTDTPDFSSQQSRCPRTREKYVYRIYLACRRRRAQEEKKKNRKKEAAEAELDQIQPLPRQFFCVGFFLPLLASDAAASSFS